jgi:hypothetical protein
MTSAGSAAPETITVVQDARGRPLTKSFRRLGGRIVKGTYPNASEFRAYVVEVDSIASLATVLDEIATDGHTAVIRGAPGRFYPRNGSPAFRLLQPQEGLVSARTGARISQHAIRKYNLVADEHRYAVTWLPTFEDGPRSWVIFDVDRVPVPDHLIADWVDEPDAAVEHVLGLLPEPFRTTTCWWSLSSSAAVPDPAGRVVSDTFKLKLAFWLDRPLLGKEVKRWMAAEKAPVDPAVFGAVQLIYVARPTFAHELHDPVPRRSGIWQGEADSVVVPELLPEPAAATYGSAAADFGPAEGLDELCDALRARLAGELHVREHLLQAARAYVRQHGPDIDQAALVAALEAVACEHRSRAEVAAYGVGSMVDYVVGNERAATWMAFGGPAPKGILPPYFGDEAPNLFREVNRQRCFLCDWLRRNHLCAIARHAIAARRQAASPKPGSPRWRRSTSMRRPRRRRPRSSGTRPPSPGGSASRCSPSSASTGCQSGASAP